MLGTLHNGTLAMGELRRFTNTPLRDKHTLTWDIPKLYQEILLGLRELGAQEANVHSISCTAWPSDYMLFASDGSMLTPVFHHADPRGVAGLKKLHGKVAGGLGFVVTETGIPATPTSTTAQLAAETRRIKKAHCLLPIADGFNYLLSGVPAAEISSASTTQLLNPTSRQWSEHLQQDLDLRKELLPLIANSGTKLGALKPELARDARLDEVQVVASCSNSAAAGLAGLPLEPGRDWAYLSLGDETVIGAELPSPLINEVTRKLDYTNELCFGGAANFHRRTIGLSILNACRRYWLDQDRELSEDILLHLTTTSPAFESLINPADLRFAEPGDMPLKVQAFCRETGQEVPRKPGQIIRCVLESLALHYRKTLSELEVITGRNFERLYLFGGGENSLLNNFIANAVQLPVIIVSPDAVPLGNVLVQSLALGHINSLDEGRAMLRRSFRTQAIVPHPAPWDSAAERLLNLIGHIGEPTPA